MTKIIFCTILLLLVPQVFLSSPLDRALIAVDDPAPGTAAKLLGADITVVRDMERYLLVVASPDERARMDALGVAWEMLDERIEGKTYYTVDLTDDIRRDRIRTGVRFLKYDDFGAVVESSPARIMQVSAEGLEIARVFIRPIRLSPVDKPFPTRAPVQVDPVIEAMVDSVSTSIIDSTVVRLQNFVTRFAAHDSCESARNYIRGRFESFGIDSVYFHSYSPNHMENVVAVIPGVVDPSRMIVIGGHYDSITWDLDDCPGADDNASGTSGVIECARVLSNYQFDFTIVFIAFCGEELGLWGSERYALDAAARGDDIIGMINIDMIGYVAPSHTLDLDIIDNESSEWLRDVVMSVGSLYVPELPLVDGALPGSASSDHASFWAQGFDAIMFFEDSRNHSPLIHTPEDRVGPSYRSPELAELSTKLGVALVATVARPFVLGIKHTPLASTEDSQNPYRVAADIVAEGMLNPDSLVVRYYNGTGVFTEAMVSSGVGNEYEAYIPAQPGGTTVDYYIVAEDTEGHRAVHPAGAPGEMHRFIIGVESLVLEDDFETDNGWTVGDSDDDATTGIWERVDPIGTWFPPNPIQPEDDHTPAPGVLCFITGNAPEIFPQGEADVDGGKTTLFSPVFDLSGFTNAWVRYYRWYSNDLGGVGNPVTDQWKVDVSDDNGQNWTRIETLAKSDRSWRLVERNLRDYIPLTSSVQLRFIASDDSLESIVEAGVDDFSIFTYVDVNTSVGGGKEVPTLISLAQNFPNPFNPETTIRFQIDGPVRTASLVVYDVAGRRVATLLDNQPVTGEMAIRWDGRDDDGQRVTTGVYFYRLEAGGKSLAQAHHFAVVSSEITMPKFPGFANRTTHITGSVFEKFRPKFEAQGDNLVKLHIGDSYSPPTYDLPIDPAFTRAHPQYNRYCDTFGIAALREALVEKIGADNGMTVGAEDIMITAGATNALSVAVQSLVEPGEEVLLLAPYWPFFRGMVSVVGGRPIEVPFYTALYQDPHMDIGAYLERRVTSKTVALYVNTPNNPSGKVLDRAQLDQIAAFAGRHNLWLISDEAYDGMTFDGRPHLSIGSLPNMFERTLSMFTFSKVFMFSGLRLGYVVGDRRALRELNKIMVHQLYSPSTIGQQMMVEPVKARSQWSGAFAAHIQALRDLFVDNLIISPQIPEGAYYLFFSIREHLRGRGYWEVIDACMDNGVSVAPGEDFGADYTDYIRLCFAGEPPDRLERSIERLNEVFPA